MKPHWKPLINIIVPGAGLIVLRREWLGLAVSLLFGLLAQIGVGGLWLFPAAIPQRVAVAALGLAGLVWLGAQWLTLRRIKSATGPIIEREILVLCHRADDAIASGRFAEADDLLLAARQINDEHPVVNRKLAESAARAGRRRDAVRAWRRVKALAGDPESRAHADRRLHELRERCP